MHICHTSIQKKNRLLLLILFGATFLILSYSFFYVHSISIHYTTTSIEPIGSPNECKQLHVLMQTTIGIENVNIPFVNEQLSSSSSRHRTKQYQVTYKNAIRRSIIPGSGIRLRRFLEKIQHNQPVHLTFVGGSITAQKTWADKIVQWLKATFPHNADITHDVVGIGGQGSGYWRLCVQNHVSRVTDLFFLDVAVNDIFEPATMAAQEEIVRKLLVFPHSPAIVFINFDTIIRNEYSTGEETVVRMAEYYDLSMVSMRRAFHRYYWTNPLAFSKRFLEDAHHLSTDGFDLVANLTSALFLQQQCHSALFSGGNEEEEEKEEEQAIGDGEVEVDGETDTHMFHTLLDYASLLPEPFNSKSFSQWSEWRLPHKTEWYASTCLSVYDTQSKLYDPYSNWTIYDWGVNHMKKAYTPTGINQLFRVPLDVPITSRGMVYLIYTQGIPDNDFGEIECWLDDDDDDDDIRNRVWLGGVSPVRVGPNGIPIPHTMVTVLKTDVAPGHHVVSCLSPDTMQKVRNGFRLNAVAHI